MTSHGEARKLRRSHSRPGAHPSVAWKWSLESGLRSKDSRAVRRRVVGKVPIEATRWRPILRQARFWRPAERGDPSAEFNEPQGDHLTGPEVRLGMFGEACQMVINLTE